MPPLPAPVLGFMVQDRSDALDIRKLWHVTLILGLLVLLYELWLNTFAGTIARGWLLGLTAAGLGILVNYFTLTRLVLFSFGERVDRSIDSVGDFMSPVVSDQEYEKRLSLEDEQTALNFSASGSGGGGGFGARASTPPLSGAGRTGTTTGSSVAGATMTGNKTSPTTENTGVFSSVGAAEPPQLIGGQEDQVGGETSFIDYNSGTEQESDHALRARQQRAKTRRNYRKTRDPRLVLFPKLPTGRVPLYPVCGENLIGMCPFTGGRITLYIYRDCWRVWMWLSVFYGFWTFFQTVKIIPLLSIHGGGNEREDAIRNAHSYHEVTFFLVFLILFHINFFWCAYFVIYKQTALLQRVIENGSLYQAEVIALRNTPNYHTSLLYGLPTGGENTPTSSTPGASRIPSRERPAAFSQPVPAWNYPSTNPPPSSTSTTDTRIANAAPGFALPGSDLKEQEQSNGPQHQGSATQIVGIPLGNNNTSTGGAQTNNVTNGGRVVGVPVGRSPNDEQALVLPPNQLGTFDGGPLQQR
ncbi:unnamed protein product [Amoebophrya sp. A120]|nr:unnamed protein product [Amoebophrya sp. A120]|eukprot:GSA120T00003158001.1